MSKLKMLWIKADPLHPLNTGGKIRTYNMLVELKKYYEITFFSLTSKGLEQKEENVSLYSDKQIWVDWEDCKTNKIVFLYEVMKNFLFSSLPFVIARYTRKNIQTALAGALKKTEYDIVMCDFLSLSQNLMALPKDNNIPYILFQHNVESKIWERYVSNASNVLSKFYFKSQWQRYLKYEKNTCQKFDGVIAVSKSDSDIFVSEFSLNNVLGDVPTGVDVDYFQASQGIRDKNSLIFLGSMDWMPNIDGISCFIDSVYPLIKKKVPDIKLTILGRNPTSKVIAFAESDASIYVTGTVDDIRPFLAQATMAIVPLRIGGGTRIKIFEAMASGLPVVSTTIGAEGLPIEQHKTICLADDPEDFAKEVCSLLSDPAQSKCISDNGLNLVKSQFGWDKVVDKFIRMIKKVNVR